MKFSLREFFNGRPLPEHQDPTELSDKDGSSPWSDPWAEADVREFEDVDGNLEIDLQEGGRMSSRWRKRKSNVIKFPVSMDMADAIRAGGIEYPPKPPEPPPPEEKKVEPPPPPPPRPDLRPGTSEDDMSFSTFKRKKPNLAKKLRIDYTYEYGVDPADDGVRVMFREAPGSSISKPALYAYSPGTDRMLRLNRTSGDEWVPVRTEDDDMKLREMFIDEMLGDEPGENRGTVKQREKNKKPAESEPKDDDKRFDGKRLSFNEWFSRMYDIAGADLSPEFLARPTFITEAHLAYARGARINEFVEQLMLQEEFDTEESEPEEKGSLSTSSRGSSSKTAGEGPTSSQDEAEDGLEGRTAGAFGGAAAEPLGTPGEMVNNVPEPTVDGDSDLWIVNGGLLGDLDNQEPVGENDLAGMASSRGDDDEEPDSRSSRQTGEPDPRDEVEVHLHDDEEEEPEQDEDR